MAEEKKENQSREGKIYALRSSAIRAAKQDGLVEGQYELKQKGKDWFYVKSASYKSVEAQMGEHKKNNEKKVEPEKKIVETPKPVVKKSAKALLDEQFQKDLAEINRKKLEEKANTPEPEVATPAPELPPERTNIKSATSSSNLDEHAAPRVVATQHRGKPITKAEDGKIHKSQIESPTKRVWHIADEMSAKNPSVTRKQVIEECTRQGIAYFTARTQYQQWLTAKRESTANAAKVNGNGKK